MLHTVDDALREFTLIGGSGSEDAKEACAMTLLAWICGEEWSDHPPCAHNLIADVVIRANDDSGDDPGDAQRACEARDGRGFGYVVDTRGGCGVGDGGRPGWCV